jgi:hypothetical protein
MCWMLLDCISNLESSCYSKCRYLFSSVFFFSTISFFILASASF